MAIIILKLLMVYVSYPDEYNCFFFKSLDMCEHLFSSLFLLYITRLSLHYAEKHVQVFINRYTNSPKIHFRLFSI